MRVLVTGAAGYVGYAVGRRLVAAGHEVDGLVRAPGRTVPPGVRPVVGDLLGPLTLDGTYDAVCHLAALTRVRESFTEPLRFYTANVQGTVHLLDALRGEPTVVYGSTGAVYGTPDELPVLETQPAAPSNPYGASKLAAEDAVRYQAATGQIGAVVLRTFNVSGSVDGRGDPDPTRLIPRALAVAAGTAPHLEVNGDGGAVREYLHVDDLARAYELALTAATPGTHRVYNVGSGVGASVAEVIGTVEKVTGRDVRVVHRPPAPEPPLLLSDTAAIRRDLGWAPERSALAEVVGSAWEALQAR
ncbi:NAD-dependent epimerase/dehydratase family protein [Spirillospora sp. NPDC049652]